MGAKAPAFLPAMGKLWDGQSLILGQIKGVPIGLHFTLLLLAFVDEIFWIAHDGFWGVFKGIFLVSVCGRGRLSNVV